MRRSLAGDLTWADNQESDFLRWSDSSSEVVHHIGGPRVILETSKPSLAPSVTASPAGSISPVSSLHSSPEGPQRMDSAAQPRPAFARLYDSPAFSPDRRLRDAQTVSPTADAELETQEWLQPSRSGVASRDLSSMHGGLAGMLGLSSPPAPGSASRQGPAIQGLPLSQAGPGPAEDIVMRTLARPPTAAHGHGSHEQHVALPANASHLRVFDSPAYAASDAGMSNASSSAHSSRSGSPLLAGNEPGSPSRLRVQSVHNSLYQEHHFR